jgi:hypothetical protein
MKDAKLPLSFMFQDYLTIFNLCPFAYQGLPLIKTNFVQLTKHPIVLLNLQNNPS